MVRLLLLLLSAAACALGVLTVVKPPEWVPWEAAILAGEYGYVVAAVPAAALLFTVFGSGFTVTLIRVLALVAIALLVQPCFQAWAIGRRLPAALASALGRSATGQAFEWRGLFGPAVQPVACETMAFEPKLALDLYRPPASSQGSSGGGRPCVVVIHGGGWNSGEKRQIPSLNWMLAREGYVVADVSYQLAPEGVWPAQRADILSALRFLKERALQFGIDPSRFVLLGRSAGGQIAEAVAYSAGDPAIRGVVALYAPADMNFAYRYGREDDALKSPTLLRAFLGGPPSVAQAAYDSASGYGLVTPQSPPTLLAHGELDTLVWYRQSQRLAARLAEHHVPHYLLSLPWATHALEYHPQGPSGQLTLFAVRAFIADVTQ